MSASYSAGFDAVRGPEIPFPLEPSSEPDPDVIELRFRVKVNGQGVMPYLVKHGQPLIEWGVHDILLREAIAAWESEGLIVEAYGERA